MPDTDWFDPTDADKVRTVKAAMHVSAASQSAQEPACRSRQASELRSLIQNSMQQKQAAAIYVSGIPGSGKSLTVHCVAQQCAQAAAAPLQENHSSPAAPLVISINCMSVAQPGDVTTRILEELQAAAGQGADCDAGGAPARERLKAQLTFPTEGLERKPARRKTGGAHWRQQQRMVILILDELDRLIGQDQAVLNELFLLPQAPQSRLVLIGIANSIDLTERCLPQLAALGCKPHLLTFPSYSADELLHLLHLRQAALPGPAFQDSALRMCARMVATRSGDMRRALEVCASAIDQLVDDAVEEASLQQTSEGEAVAPLEHRQVRLAQMSRAISRSQGGSGAASAVVATMKGLPPQQQLVLCALLLLLGREASSTQPSTPVKTPLKPRQAPTSRPSPITPSKRKLPSARSVPSPFHTPKKARRDASGRLTPAAKGLFSPAKGSPGLAGAQCCTLGALQDCYAAMMRKVSLRPLGSMEFGAACSTLGDLGVVTLSHMAQEERYRRISLQASHTDVLLALRDSRLCQDCLANGPAGDPRSP